MSLSDTAPETPTPIDAAPQRTKPFLKWAGGKSKLLGELIPRMPKRYARYVEPMLGGGALFFAVRPAKSLLFDVNPELINCYRVVQKNVEELIEDLGRHRYEQRYFYTLRDADRNFDFLRWSPVARASRTIYLNKTCFNGLYRVNSRGNFNVPYGRYTNPTLVAPETLRACSRALKGASLRCGSFEALPKHLAEGDFVYFDPPYVPLSKTSSFATYAKDGFGLDEQVKLRDLCVALDKRGIKFMLSNSYTDTVLELYEKFSIDVVDAPRVISAKGSRRHSVKEVIVRNYK
ncbi:MAG: DNA adenine methylase [Proteobacteria bacterium]|nr:DNA adenine methylase [Pseudomonadota bacterium]